LHSFHSFGLFINISTSFVRQKRPANTNATQEKAGHVQITTINRSAHAFCFSCTVEQIRSVNYPTYLSTSDRRHRRHITKPASQL